MAAEKTSKILFHGVCNGAKGDSTGYIGGAIEVLCTGIDQQKVFREERGVTYLGGCIVDNSAVWTVGGYSFEAFAKKVILFASKSFKASAEI
jgi:hypothetical protein